MMPTFEPPAVRQEGHTFYDKKGNAITVAPESALFQQLAAQCKPPKKAPRSKAA